MMALSGVRSSWRHVRQELRLVLRRPASAELARSSPGAPANSVAFSIAITAWSGERSRAARRAISKPPERHASDHSSQAVTLPGQRSGGRARAAGSLDRPCGKIAGRPATSSTLDLKRTRRRRARPTERPSPRRAPWRACRAPLRARQASDRRRGARRQPSASSNS